MAWKLTADGNDITSSVDSMRECSIARPLNSRPTARFTFMGDSLGSFLRFDEVVMYARDGTTPIFGGIIWNRNAVGVVAGSTSTYTEVECVGFVAYADWRYTNLSYTSPVTLVTVLNDLIAESLTDYGITIDGGQVTGPTLEPFAWVNVRVSDALRDLVGRATGASGDSYVFAINPSKALKAFAIGTDAAPAVTGSDLRDVTARDSEKIPYNFVTIACGPDGPEAVTQFWTADGVASSWVADIAVAHGTSDPPTVLVNAVTKTVGPGANYEWDADTATLTLGTATLPTAGQIIELVYTARFPFTVTATASVTPIIEYQEARPEIKTVAAGQEYADGKLAELNQSTWEVTATSVVYAAWDAGQSLSATFMLADRLGFGPIDLLVTNVQIVLVADEWWRYTISFVSGTAYTGGYLERWRELGVTAA